MTLEQIIAIVNDVYDDGLVGSYHDEPTGDHGDTLAKFIAIELRETYEAEATDSEQLWEAQRVMLSAYEELGKVVDAFENAAIEAQQKENQCPE